MSVLVAIAALFLGDHYQAPVMLFALLLGLAVNFLSSEGRCKPGIDFASKHLLRSGVALLGLKITLSQVQALGWIPVLMVMLGVVATIAFGVLLSRLMGFQSFFGFLSGGAVGICGASAAMAISASFPQHPHKERATLFVVICVSTLSTMAMVAYPMLADWLVLDSKQAGFFLGGTIHDVAQVVGAGYSKSQETGDTATLVKLMRVAMLVPVIFAATCLTRLVPIKLPESHEPQTATIAGRPPLLPGFAVLFAILVLINGFELFPKWMIDSGNTLSRWLLVCSMAAIGMKTHLKEILSVGWRPIALMILETCFLTTLVAVMLKIMPIA
jgi:uncharacterized integral membrane protein (TIGR00698 family)